MAVEGSLIEKKVEEKVERDALELQAASSAETPVVENKTQA